MIRMKLMILVSAAAVFTASAAGAQAFKRIGTRAEVKPSEPNIWGTNAPSLPAGEAEGNINVVTPEGFCCRFNGSCNLPGPFNPGNVLSLNTYWEETVPNPYPGGNWVVSWSLGVLPDGTPPPLLILFQDEPVSFGDLSAFAGQTLTFCVSGTVQVPPQGAGRCNIGMGYKVTTPGGSVPPTVVDSFGINPCP